MQKAKQQKAKQDKGKASLSQLAGFKSKVTENEVKKRIYEMLKNKRHAILPDALRIYLHLLDYPFTRGLKAKIPFHPDLMPHRPTVSFTTVGRLSSGVSTNESTYIAFFPGHATDASIETSAPGVRMNDTLTINATNYVCGPCNSTGSVTSTAGCLWTDSGAVAGQTANDIPLSTAQTAANPMPWANPGPYKVLLGSDGRDLAWRLVSLGVKIIQRTKRLDQSGTIASFLPSKFNPVGVGPEPWSEGANNPSYSEKSFVGGEFTFRWLPRNEDLYFYTVRNAAVSEIDAAGLWIRIGDAAAAQTFTVEYVAHWELQGYDTRNQNTPAVVVPRAGATAIRAIQTATNAPQQKGMLKEIAAVQEHHDHPVMHALGSVIEGGAALVGGNSIIKSALGSLEKAGAKYIPELVGSLGTVGEYAPLLV